MNQFDLMARPKGVVRGGRIPYVPRATNPFRRVRTTPILNPCAGHQAPSGYSYKLLNGVCTLYNDATGQVVVEGVSKAGVGAPLLAVAGTDVLSQATTFYQANKLPIIAAILGISYYVVKNRK